MNAVAAQVWPAEGLEVLGQCPVCASPRRHRLFTGLTDSVFRCAPGTWQLHCCEECLVSYLDPRPTAATIGAAYEGYYTHESTGERDEFAKLDFWRKARRLFSNSYTNVRYGTRFSPSSLLLSRAAALMPALTRRLDTQFRWLPRPAPGACLLDVGCGNGAFLRVAALAGWQAHGADPDPAAIALARRHTPLVRTGGIEAFQALHEHFDAITLSHSIEHVHDPRQVLRIARSLLKRDGVLFVDTPNTASRGLRRFGSNWRGLEPPRHLVLFHFESLSRLLEEEGFGDIRPIRRNTSFMMACASQMLRKGLSPYAAVPRNVRLAARAWAWRPFAATRKQEFVTLLARRA